MSRQNKLLYYAIAKAQYQSLYNFHIAGKAPLSSLADCHNQFIN